MTKVTTMEDLAPCGSDVKVMVCPANTHRDCQHQECLRRRAERYIPCAICHRQIWTGASYRVLSRVDWTVTAQVHEDCRIALAAEPPKPEVPSGPAIFTVVLLSGLVAAVIQFSGIGL